ncbi:hypothetical protein COOONC_26234 [Cooperia oncophora]
MVYTLYMYAKAFIFPIFNLSSEIYYTFYSALGDIYAGIGAYLLWIFSDALRHYVCTKLRIRKPKAQLRSSVIFINVRTE